MHITAMTVCVDYAHHLERSLERWKQIADKLLVVTAERDTATRALCESHGVATHCTDLFWANGAKFNKGRGIADAYYRNLSPVPDWMLFFDADIVPPEGCRAYIEANVKRPEWLYGCYRTNEAGLLFGDPDIAGYFHLAHISSPHMQVKPIVDTHWAHAGNYDSTFQDRWSKAERVRLDMRVIHLGDEPGANWMGVGNKHLVDAMHRERRRRRGRWDHETPDNIQQLERQVRRG